MNVLETDWWLLSLPEHWEAAPEDESVVITDPDSVGELLITTLVMEQGAAVDLKQLMVEAEVNPADAVSAEIGDFAGFVTEPAVEEDEYLREWYVTRDNLVLIVSYQCAAEDRNMDCEVIDEILSTIGVKVADGDA